MITNSRRLPWVRRHPVVCGLSGGLLGALLVLLLASAPSAAARPAPAPPALRTLATQLPDAGPSCVNWGS